MEACGYFFFPFRENHILYMRSTFKLKLTLKILKNIPYIMFLKQPHSTRHTTKSMIFINQNISTIWVKYLDFGFPQQVASLQK